MIDPESRFEEQLGHLELVQRRFQAYKNYLARLDKQVEKGLITPEERIDIIATELFRKDSRKEEAQEKARTDSLTGLPNRRAFDADYAELVQSKKPFGLLIADLDHFKKINDTHGHRAGDDVLIQTSMLLRLNIREEGDERGRQDIVSRIGKVGRIGGEEFAILLPDVSSIEDLRNIAERIRTSISSEPLQVTDEYGKEIQQPVTISLGGGLYTSGENPAEFFHRVDKRALYEAKGEGREDKGRNRTVILMPRKLIRQQAA